MGFDFLQTNFLFFVQISNLTSICEFQFSTTNNNTHNANVKMRVVEKFGFLYSGYVLGVLTVGYILGELGHYLIGVTSKQTAIELDYGDHACQLNNTMFTRTELPVQCSSVMNETG